MSGKESLLQLLLRMKYSNINPQAHSHTPSCQTISLHNLVIT